MARSNSVEVARLFSECRAAAERTRLAETAYDSNKDSPRLVQDALWATVVERRNAEEKLRARLTEALCVT